MRGFNPRVSIIIPVYNGANYLKRAIDSALAQTYKNIEVIVVNDGSTDTTENIALSYGDRIRYFSKKNGGVATALNLAIEKADGEYISWLSHDDEYYPEKIEKQIKALEQQQCKEQIVYCSVTVIDENGNTIKNNIVSKKAETSTKCFLTFDTESGLNGCSLLIPRMLFFTVGNFNEKLISTQDYELWFRFANAGVKFMGISDELVYSRAHAQQGCRTLPNITLDSDKLHYGFIEQLTFDEISEYGDFDYYQQQYQIYKNAGYIRTSAQILKILLNFLKLERKEEKLINLLNFEIFNLDSVPDNVKKSLAFIYQDKQKPRIIFYSVAWTKGGLETVLKTVFAHINNDYEIILISNFGKGKKGFPLPKNVRHLQIKNVKDESLTKRLFLSSVVFETDVFIGNSNIYLEVLKVYKLLKSVNIKTIAVNHGNYFLPYSTKFLYKTSMDRLSYLDDANIVTWLTTFNTQVYNLTNNNGYVLPNPNSYPITDCIPSKKGKTILCVGRFYDSIKRIDRALKVFKLVLEEHNDAQLVLVGPYNENQVFSAEGNKTLKEILKNLNIPEANIKWVGEVSDVTPYYKSADLLLVTSESEGFCMVINEAAAFGVPCVYFKIAGLEDIITNNVNGIEIEQDDIKTMACKITELFANREILNEMGINAQKLVERFETQKIINKWRFLIELCLNNSNEQISEILAAEISTTNNLLSNSFAKNLVSEYEKNINKIIMDYNESIAFIEQKLSNIQTSDYEIAIKEEMQLAGSKNNIHRKKIAKNKIWRFFYRVALRPCLKLVYGVDKVHTKFDVRFT